MTDREKNLAIYDKLVSMIEGLERKGKTMPYTASNGHMFSQLNKPGQIGIRLSGEDAEEFRTLFGSEPFVSYGAVMKDYVVVPEDLLQDLYTLTDYLQKGLDYVNSLEPK